MTDMWPRLRRQPWIWSFIAMVAVWLATVIFTRGQGAGDILTAALSFADLHHHRRPGADDGDHAPGPAMSICRSRRPSHCLASSP